MKKKLTSRQQRFVAHYLVAGEPARAAIHAGYVERTAEVTAGRLLQMPAVAAALEDAQVAAGLPDAAGISAIAGSPGSPGGPDQLTRQWIVARLQEVVARCMQAEAVPGKKNSTEQGQYKFDAANANRALHLLGKYLHMFSERVEHQVSMHEAALEELE